MAPSINPFQRKSAPLPKPADPAQKQALLDRATGKKPAVPPAASLPPGITGTMPIPTGRPVGHTANGRTLTELEAETLAGVGWTPDMGLPTTQEGMKQFQQALSAMNEVDVPLPVDPRTPALQVKTVPIEQLPPADQARMRENLKTTVANIRAAEAQKLEQARRMNDNLAKEAAVAGIGQAGNAADAAMDAFKRKVTTPVEEAYEVPVAPPQAPAPAAPPPVTHDHVTKSETGADATLARCPHCDWDLAHPDIPEPSEADKQAFLHTLLGDRPFVKDFPLYGGAISLTFRSLTIQELDVVYLQTWEDQRAGKILSDLDYHERLNRYRMLLQLRKVDASVNGGVVTELPDGYSKTTNPASTGVWCQPEKEGELYEVFEKEGVTSSRLARTILPDIEKWIVEEALKTEHLFRIANTTCNQFNRMVAKLEAMADHSDFLKPTGGPS